MRSPPKRFRWVSILHVLLVAQAVACSTPKVSLGRGVRAYVPNDYASVLDQWTRDKTLLVPSELEAPLTVTATYESWDFRWAYVIRYAQDYRLTIEQRRDLLEHTLAETENMHQFYVAFYGTKWKWDNLTKPNSAWILRLIDDVGSETAPSKIDWLERPGALEVRYFPYTTPWRHAYRVQFPVRTEDGRLTIDPSARWFGLRFAGAEGNDELRWEIIPAGPTAPATPTAAARSLGT